MRRLLCLAALTLASCAHETTLVFHPGISWRRSQSASSAIYKPSPYDYSHYVPEGAELNIPPAHTSDTSQVTFAAIIEARQVVADTAKAHGLTLRIPTRDEAYAGYNEIYTGPRDDGEIRVKENLKGTQLDITVREPSKNGTIALELKGQLGIR